MKKKISLTTKIFIGLFGGALLGLALQGNPQIADTYIKPFGTLFLNMIKMVIVPLVFSSLVVGAASIGASAWSKSCTIRTKRMCSGFCARPWCPP